MSKFESSEASSEGAAADSPGTALPFSGEEEPETTEVQAFVVLLFGKIRVRGLEAPFGNGLEAHWTHWLEASVTGNRVTENLPKQE